MDHGVRFFYEKLSSILDNNPPYSIHKLLFTYFFRRTKLEFTDGVLKLMDIATKQLRTSFSMLDLFSDKGVGEPKYILRNTLLLAESDPLS